MSIIKEKINNLNLAKKKITKKKEYWMERLMSNQIFKADNSREKQQNLNKLKKTLKEVFL